MGIIMPAAEQRAKAPALRKDMELKRIAEYKEKIISQINRLWLIGSITLWEEDWFDGIDEFLDEIEWAGYHIYSDSGRKGGMGSTQKCYIITLNKKYGYYKREGHLEK